MMRSLFIKPLFLAAFATVALAACSPKYNWRDFSSEDAPFRAMFPDKPASHTRAIDLAGMKVDMTMTAAQIDNTTFAVGAAEAPNAERAEAALGAMKTALLNNIGATLTSEKTARSSSASGAAAARSAAVDIEAKGERKGVPMRLVGHFESRDKRFYQVIVMGPEKDMAKENVDMFMSSFKLQ
jgi:hypothetical protein